MGIRDNLDRGVRTPVGLLAVAALLLLGCLWVAKGIPGDLAAGRLVEDRVVCPHDVPRCLTAARGVVADGDATRRSTITTWVVDTDVGRVRIDDGAWADSDLDWHGVGVTVYLWEGEAVAMEGPYGEQLVSAWVGLPAVVFKGLLLLAIAVLALGGLVRAGRVLASGRGWFAAEQTVSSLPLPASAVLGGAMAGVIAMWCGAGPALGLVVAGTAFVVPLAWWVARRRGILPGRHGQHAGR